MLTVIFQTQHSLNDFLQTQLLRKFLISTEHNEVLSLLSIQNILIYTAQDCNQILVGISSF